jgi:hypothetical protein
MIIGLGMVFLSSNLMLGPIAWFRAKTEEESKLLQKPTDLTLQTVVTDSTAASTVASNPVATTTLPTTPAAGAHNTALVVAAVSPETGKTDLLPPPTEFA